MPKQLLVLAWAIFIMLMPVNLHGQYLPQSSADLFNVPWSPALHLKHVTGGYHQVYARCPDSSPAWQLITDASGNGFRAVVDCATHAKVEETLFSNWEANGPAYWRDAHSSSVRVTAQFHSGLLTSVTFRSCGGPLTLSLPNGTGEWKVPDFDDCKNNPNGIHETGQLKNGVKEGRWYGENLGVTTPRGKVYEVTYIDGSLDGVCKWFYGGNPVVIADYLKGIPNGDFTYINPISGLRVEGENKDGDATGVLIERPGPNTGKAWGTWKFFSANGMLLGQDVLIDGNGHFKTWRADSTLNFEGNLKNGLRVGDWTEYDDKETPIAIISFSDGQFVSYKPYPDQTKAH